MSTIEDVCEKCPEIPSEVLRQSIEQIRAEPILTVVVVYDTRSKSKVSSVVSWARRTAQHYNAVVAFMRAQYPDFTTDYTTDFGVSLIKVLRTTIDIANGTIKLPDNADGRRDTMLIESLLLWYCYEYVEWITHNPRETYANVHALTVSDADCEEDEVHLDWGRFNVSFDVPTTTIN